MLAVTFVVLSSGNVMETVEMFIKPKKGMGTMDDPPCTLNWMQER
jgi:hypothetical protein